MAAIVPITPVGNDALFVMLAREIAMDIHPLETILKNHEITQGRWQEIRNNARFIHLLQSQVEEWNGALNTAERVRIKALSCIEEALPEFFARMHAPDENLPAKVRALEVFGQLAGIGKSAQVSGNGGEKFSVTINLGQDQVLKVSAPATPPAVLDQ
jgi:hypothetical protein